MSAPSTPLPPWSALTLDARTDAILEAILGGGSAMDVRQPHEATALEVVGHMSTPEFKVRALAILGNALVAASMNADLLKAAMLLNGTAGKDGLAYKELKLLLDKLGNNVQAPEVKATDDKDAEAAALRLIEQNQWKFSQQPQQFVGPKAEA